VAVLGLTPSSPYEYAVTLTGITSSESIIPFSSKSNPISFICALLADVKSKGYLPLSINVVIEVI